MAKIKEWYWRWSLARKRQVIEAHGEIWFGKYERDGAYHWDFYYCRPESFYRRLVDTVAGMVPSGARVLDLGCGDGLLAHRLAQTKGCHVTGVDLHPLAVSYARAKNGGRNKFEVGSVYDCGDGGNFDVVTAIEVFEHLAHPEKMMVNAARVLREEGVMIVSTPLADEGRPKSRYHAREYSESEFLSILGGLFDVVATERLRGESTTVVCRCVRREAQRVRDS